MVWQHEFEVAVADRELEILANCPQNDLGGKLPPFERPAATHRRPFLRTPSLRSYPNPASTQTFHQSP